MKKKLLLITSEFPPGPGGIGQHAASLVLSLAKQYDLDVLCNQDYATPSEIYDYNAGLPDNISIHPFVKRDSWLAIIKRIRQAFHLIRNEPYKFIIVSGLFPLWLGAYIKLFKPHKVHAFIHGNEVNKQGTLIERLTTFAYTRLDYLYPVSNFTKNLLEPKANSQRVAIIPNGLDYQFFDEIKHLKKTSLSLQGNPSLLTVGNVTPRKGQHRVVMALPAILEKYSEAHYHMVGLPTEKEHVMSLAKQLGVDHAVSFHGRIPRHDLYAMYSNADIFIMLSENQKDGDVEGFGIAILEANAFGIPAIGASGCGIEDAISPQSGVLVDGSNQDEIIVAIDTFRANLESFKTGARKWAERHHWNELVKLIRV